jgi:hypothetical protein
METQPQEQGKKFDRAKVDWQSVRDFTDEASGITIRLQKLPLNRPTYSFCVDGKKKDGSPSKWMKVQITAENGQVTLKTVAEVLSRLAVQMEMVAYEDRQTAEDNFYTRKQHIEEKKNGEGVKKAVRGLSQFTDGSKTEREAGKNARHQHNLEKRRAEDQTRTSNSKRH